MLAIGDLIGHRNSCWSCQLASEDPRDTVALGRPLKISEEEWSCAFLIRDSTNSNTDRAHGIDELQAFLLAIEALNRAISLSKRLLTWYGGEPGDIGIPSFVPTALGVAFRRRMEQVIDREMELFVKEMEAR